MAPFSLGNNGGSIIALYGGFEVIHHRGPSQRGENRGMSKFGKSEKEAVSHSQVESWEEKLAEQSAAGPTYYPIQSALS